MRYIIFLIKVALIELTAALLPHCSRVPSMIMRLHVLHVSEGLSLEFSGFPTTSQKHPSRWIGDCKLHLGVNECAHTFLVPSVPRIGFRSTVIGILKIE